MSQESISSRAMPFVSARSPRMLTPTHALRIFDLASGILLGHTADISTGGMRVVSRDPIPRGQAFRVWAETHCSLGYRTRTLLDVQSIWTKRTVDRGSYESGFCITDATPEAAEAIEALMSDLCASQ